MLTISEKVKNTVIVLFLLILYCISLYAIIITSIKQDTTQEMLNIFYNELTYYIVISSVTLFIVLIFLFFQIYIYKIIIILLQPEKEIVYSSILKYHLIGSFPYSIFALFTIKFFGVDVFTELMMLNSLVFINVLITTFIFVFLLWNNETLKTSSSIVLFIFVLGLNSLQILF